MTDIDSPIESLINRAKDEGILMKDVCVKAGVAESTPSRWKRGDYEPKFRTLRRMEVALAELVAAKASASTAGG